MNLNEYVVIKFKGR